MDADRGRATTGRLSRQSVVDHIEPGEKSVDDRP